MEPFKIIGALVVALTAAVSATAADAPAPQYQVELLVFRHLDQSRSTPEVARLATGVTDGELERQLAQISSIDASSDVEPLTPASAEPEPEPETDWQPVIADTRLLSKDAEKLRRIEAYELLAHLAWTQSAPDIDDAQAITLSELGLDPQRAHGSINFYSKRYLHLAVDVSLGPEVAGPNEPSDPFSFPTDAVAGMQPAISDSRRIRLGQLIYFDEPEFGVIAVAERIPGTDAE